MHFPRRFASFLAAAAAVLGVAASASSQTIPKGDFVIDVKTFATLPNSGGGNRPARANIMATSPDGRMFVNDERGIIYSLSADGATVTPYLVISSYVPLLSDDGERGFQSFAFHPNFNTPGAAGYGKFYTVTSQSDTGATATFTPGINGVARDHDEVMLEWTVSDPSAATFVPADASHPFREVMRIARPNGNHNGGFISFNPTAGNGSDRGNLYYGMGDSGGGGDPLTLAQAPGKVYGAVLRINPLAPAANDPQRSANGQYSIPADNPYTSNPNLAREKYVGGFRNPQRFSWDYANGRMFIGDIGQNKVEEIDVAVPGANYGWNQREGSFVYNSDGSIGANSRGDGATTGFTYPIAEYFHFGSIGNGVACGPVYRGSGIPGLDGRLFFSDFVTGTPYTISVDNLPNGGQDGITELRLRQNGTELSFMDLIHQVNPAATRADLRFGRDANNNIYLLDKQDGVIRQVIVTATTSPPAGAPTIGISVTVTSVSRGAGEKAFVTFTRTGDLSADLSVAYRVGGTAVNGQDFRTLNGVRPLPAGKSSVTAKIKPLPGGANGKVKLFLEPGDGYTVDGAAQKVKVFITD